MKFSEIKRRWDERERDGFRVSFEIMEGSCFRSDYFPEGEEKLLPTEEDAWAWCQRLAELEPSAVNIYVVRADHTPVESYAKWVIRPTMPPLG